VIRSSSSRAARHAAAIGLLLSACAPAAVDPADQSILAEAPESPTTLAVTTTLAMTGPYDICGPARIWTVGDTYVADCFAVPVTFAPADPGWRSVRAGGEWLESTWVDSDTREIGVRLLFLALDTTEPPEAVLDSILSIDGVNTHRGPEAAVIAGVDAITAGVVTEPRRTTVNALTCTGMTHSVDLFHGERPGYLLLDRSGAGSGATYGLGACLVFQIWALDVAGHTITVIAAAPSEDLLPEVVRRVESLLATVTLG
jgi:hypothetical protein